MIRSAAIQVGNLIKSMNIGFDDSNLFINKKIPEKLLQNKSFPIIQIYTLPTDSHIYASNRKNYETVSCQVNVLAVTNREIEKYQNLIESYLSTHQFGCFFDTQESDDNFDVQHLILRFDKTQNIKEILQNG